MESQTVEVKESKDDHQRRKEELIREGAFYRVGVAHAKAHVKEAARPEALLHSAIDHATWAVRSRVDGLLKPTGASVASLAPIVMTVIRILRNRKAGKAGIASAVVLAGVGWYLQQRRLRQAY
ncbi:MAG: hypothetical protein JWQ01_278 [Massilia sp.]|nr:hypothetical protein [Massilia sp.]